MADIVVLDSSPLWMASKARGKPERALVRSWLDRLKFAGYRVVIPEIADYEVRRERLRRGSTTGIVRLNALWDEFEINLIDRKVMLLAAQLWANSRRAGLPTSDPLALDADAILAAQASLLGGMGRTVVVATTNVRHLRRFVDARRWDTIN